MGADDSVSDFFILAPASALYMLSLYARSLWPPFTLPLCSPPTFSLYASPFAMFSPPLLYGQTTIHQMTPHKCKYVSNFLNEFYII